METRRDVFQAIADPTRRAIIALLATGSLTPNAIAENFDSSRQAVSKHIRILLECELVKQQQQGREIYYHFNPQRMKDVLDWVAPYQKMWEGRFNRLDDVLKKLNRKNKPK